MMATTAADRAALATGRSLLYDLLARGFAHPSARHRDALENHIVPALRDVRVGEPTTATALATCLEALPDDLGTLVPAHARQFPLIESRDCPTYETAYRGEDVFRQTHVMADVAGFYRANGLRVGGADRERPDHITVELEFMGFLTARQAHAHLELTDGHVEACREMERLFLGDHLGTWAPGFGRRVRATAEHPFYAALGTLLAAWVEADMAFLGVTPAEVADEPLPTPPPDDGTCGPGAAAWPVPLGHRPPS